MDTTFTADRIVASVLKASPTTRKFADLSASRAQGNIGGNDEFKRLYAGIFSLRRNAAWRRRYFEVMEGACRLKNAKLCDLLYLVSRIGERPALELRLASALLSVANPKMPAWTEPFRVALGVAAPAYGRAEPLEEQVVSALAAYDALLKAAKCALANSEVRRGLAEAARRDPVFGSLPQMRQLEVALTRGREIQKTMEGSTMAGKSRWTPERIERLRKKAYWFNTPEGPGDVYVSRRKGADAAGYWIMSKRRKLAFVIAKGSVGLPDRGDYNQRAWLEGVSIKDCVFLKDVDCLNMHTADMMIVGGRGRNGMWRNV